MYLTDNCMHACIIHSGIAYINVTVYMFSIQYTPDTEQLIIGLMNGI